MSRAANFTIKGFLYQFNKTLLDILRSHDGDTITVEGLVEDIEIASTTAKIAIQCKYHETSTYIPSDIYKPLLQMLNHFAMHSEEKIRYIIFAHFASTREVAPTLGKSDIEAALKSKDKTLQKHIVNLPKPIDVDRFLERFLLSSGPSYYELVSQVCGALKDSGIPTDDIDILAYPNALHIIADMSGQNELAKRRITKGQLVDKLKGIRTTAISRWTMALHTRTKLLEARRKQLKVHLDKNIRVRYFVIDPTGIEDYETEIVLFISDYLEKYHFKTAHLSTPVVCLCATISEVQEIQQRLYTKGIICTDGYHGGRFEETYFFRDPMVSKADGGRVKREFALRITSWGEHGSVLNNRKCDDLFVIGEPNCESLDTVDVTMERIAGTTFKELKYVMGVSNVYE